MKKIRLSFCVFFLLFMSFSAKLAAQGNCPWHVQMDVIEATCLNNGGVRFYLLTDNGDVIDIDIENKKPYDADINLSEIKFYHQSLTNLEDTVTYYSSNPRLFLNPGTYRVGVQAQCYNGGDGSGAYTPLSFEQTIEVVGSYTVPTVSILANIASSSWASGNRPTVPGDSTGRIQLRISGGSLPYTIVLVNSDNQDTVETRTVTRAENNGTNPNAATYREYFTFDNLPAASYRFYFADACDFRDTATSLSWTVEDAQAPMLLGADFHATSTKYTNYGTIYSDSNVVEFYNVHLSEGDLTDYLYNDYAQHVQYRVCYGTADTSDWKAFPLNNLRQLNDKSYNLINYLYDTAQHVRRYCEFLGQNLTLQYRNTFPGQEDLINLYTAPIENRVEWSYRSAEDVNYTGTWYDSCTFHIPGVHHYTDFYYFYRTYCSGYNLTQTPNTYPWTCVSFYTYPIHYEIIDNADNTVVTERIVENGDNWNVTKAMFEDHFGPISATMDFPATVRITDAKGCVVSQTQNIWIYNEIDTLHGNSHLYYYNHTYDLNEEAAHCCQSLKGFYITERFSSENENTHLPNPIPQRFKQTRDGAQFQLIKSPRNNKYNFTATYHFDTDEWEIVRADMTNTAEITPKLIESSTEYQWGLSVNDYCLPYGYYDFLYITDCDTQSRRVYYTSTPSYEYRYEYTLPSYTSYQECDNYFITMQTGEYRRLQIGSDTEDPLQPEKVMSETVLNTYFKIINGPQGGYPTDDFRVGSTIRLTVPGTYTLRMYTPDTSVYCRAPYYDTTITYIGGTVSFNYAYAYVCDADSTVGFFYCQAMDGMAPYHYSLYALTNMEGGLLEENNTGSFKGLSNIHVGDMMSLGVGDACGRSYYVNITVTDLSSSRLAWFDGALRVTETCEGSEIDVYVSSVDEDFTYHWTGPNGFEANTPRGHILIERGSAAGDYTVELGNTGCSQTLKDTVTLGILPAPQVEMRIDRTSVCPGEEVTIEFTPIDGSGLVSYVIGREINSIDTFYRFSGHVGDMASLTYTAESEATFWIHEVKDGLCNYTIPEDTVIIRLRDAASACDVHVDSVQVCFGATAGIVATSTTMQKPYTIRWYTDAYQQELVQTDVISDGMPDATFTTGRLYADTALYVTIQDATHCETYTGTIHHWMNMADGTTELSCGQSIRLFDDGGSNGNYTPNKYYKHTFTSTDDNLLTLSFNSFNTQQNGDVLQVYTGDDVIQDSLLALLSGSSLPQSITSHSKNMTIVFVSNGYIEAEGWDALVSCSALPAKAKIKVLDDLSVSLSITPELPIRYGQDVTLTATANGGQGARYEYTWHILDSQFNEETYTREVASNTDIFTLDNLTETKMVWVVVKDKSANPCTVEDKASNFINIEISKIALTLDLSSSVTEICQGDIPMVLTVENGGVEAARNVEVKLHLPEGMTFANEGDSLILFTEVAANGIVEDTLFIHNEIHVTVTTNVDVKAQIWSCDQGDLQSNWHSWDWTGSPAENDEDMYTLAVRPSLDAVEAPGLTVNSANICYGGDATIQAQVQSGMAYPLLITWYADAALTEVIQTDPLQDNSTSVVSHDFSNIIHEGTLCYVTAENSTYCPAYTTVDYTTKLQYTPTDTVLMHNGSSLVGNNDHVLFFDDGGVDGYYSANRRYSYIFSSVDGSPVTIYFDNDENQNYINNNNNNGKIEIYDGESDMTPRLAMYRNSEMRGKVLVANSGKMLVKFSSGDYTERGFSAHVFTSTRAVVAEANVTFKTPLAINQITTKDSTVCYGEGVLLTASSTIDFPQYYSWYDENLQWITNDTVREADSERYSSLEINALTRSSNYYVTLSNATECPVMVPTANDTYSEQEICFDAFHDGQVTTITPYDIINFYDEGGRNGSYTTHGYKHTFTALQGKLQISSNHVYVSDDTLYVYDGEDETAPLLTKWTGYIYDNATYTSSGSSITIKMYGKDICCPSGWEMQIRSSHPEKAMAQATASVKAGVPESIITDREISVCYGSEAELSASSSLTTYPQYFVWYNADRNEIRHRDTIENPGESSIFRDTPNSETFYYVTVTNSDNCPINESQLPQDTNNLVKIKVTFSEPVISNNVTVNDDVVCYGQNASLTATTNDGTAKHIYWYDEYFNLINDEIGTTSTIEPPVAGNAVYFVNAVETNQCGILPPGYGKFFFDASKDGETTNLVTGEMIPFYDAGGPNANYNTPGADWTHTFVAPAGKQVTLRMKSFHTSGHVLYVYDGTQNNHYTYRTFNGRYGNTNETFTTTRGRLTLRWVIQSNVDNFNYPGWEGEIGVLDAHNEMHTRNTELAAAHVSVKSIADQLASITTTGATVCYGSEAVLTASSTMDYPQTFYWFNSGRDSLLRQHTIDAGRDTLTVRPTAEGNYYVYVTNSNNCPLPEPVHDNHRVLLFNRQEAHDKTLADNDIIEIYDDGGLSGDFSDCLSDYYNFTAPQGSRIRIHFNNIQLGSNNNYLRLYMRKSDNNYEDKYIYGTLSDTDFVSESNYVQISFQNNCDGVTAAGWDGYLYALTPIDAENLVAANVNFTEPTFSQNVTTSDVESCYGNTVTLTASNIGINSRYAWFDENYNLIKDTVGQYGTLDITALNNTIYYVNASAANGCPVIPPYYGAFFFDDSKQNGTTNLTAGESIPFFDAGGPNNNYETPGADWVHTFIAPAGKQVTLLLNSFKTAGGHRLYIYDGTRNEYSDYREYSGNYGNMNYTFTSSNGVLTVRWYIENNANANNFTFPGWEGEVGVKDNNTMTLAHPNLAAAHISIKVPLAASEITTVDAEACYGASATLQASATNNTLDYPQIFYWYDENQGFLGCDTVNSGETSGWTITNLNTSAPYYVTMSNATECPVEMTSELLLNSTTTGQTTILNDHYSVRFYDEGGDNRSYENRGGSLTHSFVSENGAVYLTFEDYISTCSNDTLYIYDGNSADNGQLLAIYTQGYNTLTQPIVYTSGQGAITVKFSQHYNGGCNGWKAIASTQPTPATSPTVLLNAANNGHSTLVVPNETVNFYDEGGRNNSYQPNADYTHTFKALQGNVSIHFINCVSFCTDDTLYIYDGENVNGTLLGLVGDWVGCSNPTMVSTGSAITVRFKGSDCNSSGWRAQITTVNPQTAMAQVNATIKAPLSPDTIQTQDLVDCYGRDGYVTATTPGLTGDQTYKWYGPDLMEPIYSETVPEGGTSRLPVQVLRNETYYVTVSNAENCAVAETIRDNYREILMGSGNHRVNLAASDSVCLFDRGGKNGNCTANGSSDSHDFYGPTEDSRIILHINSLNASPDNGYLQINLYDADGNYTTKYLYTSNGVFSDKDFVSMGNRMYVNFYPGSDGQEYPGLDAYLYAIVPYDTNELASATVTIKATLSPDTIQTQNLVDCYGRDGYVTATTPGLTGDQTYKWYGTDLLSPIYTETVPEGGTSRLPVQVLRNETYYVTVSNAENCAVAETIHNNYREVLMGSDNYQIDLAASDSVCLFDRGGKNGNCTANGSGDSHDFYGPTEDSRIILHINSLNASPYDGQLQISLYDADGNYTTKYLYTSNGIFSDTDFVSMGNRMYVYFYPGTDGQEYPGLDAYLYTIVPHDTNELASATVTVKAPLAASEITTVDAEACYGASATLQASATNNTLDYPQIFYWYDENQGFLGCDTVDSGETSEWTITNLTTSATYYVTMSNATECPVQMISELLLNSTTTGQTTTLNDHYSVRFYDEGGDNRSYENRGGSLTHSFVSENGAVYLTFEDYINICSNDTLYIYNGNSAENGQLLAIYTQGYNTLSQPVVYTSAQGAITVKFSQHYNGGCNGWKAIASTQPTPETSPTVLLNAVNNGHNTLVVPNETLNFYDEGGRNNYYQPNADYTHTFKVLQGNVSIHFINCVSFCTDDTLYIYDGENVNGTLLGVVGSWTGCSNPTMVSTGSDMTVRFKGSSCVSSGWQAQITAVNPQTSMAEATATIKAPLSPDTIQTQDFTDCYGRNGYLTATTPGLTGEQTYKWYGPDLMKPIYSETVPEGGMSRLPVRVLRNETYYVTVSNAENCAVVETVHNNYREVLMGSGNYQVDLAASDSVCLFDKGGKNDNCIADGNGYSHNFYGPTEDYRIILHINSLNASPNGGQLQINLYDANGNYTTKYLYTSNGVVSDTDFVSMGNNMYVYFYPGSDGQEYPGLDAYIYAIVPHDTNELAPATVSIKTLSPNLINAPSHEICYGSDVELWATSTIGTDQHFVWFEPDRITRHTETVHTIGERSTYTVPSPQQECTYYVAVYNDTTCPLTEPVYDDERVVLFERNSNGEYDLTENMLYRIYDDGGPNGSYDNSGNLSTYRCFNSPQNNYLKVHFDAIDLADDARLYIRRTDTWREVFKLQGPVHISDTDIVIDYRRIEIRIENYSNNTDDGFAGSVCALSPQPTRDLFPVPITFTVPEIASTVTVSDTLACYGTPVQLEASIPGSNSTMHYSWYDENMNLMYEEDASSSIYSRLATANERFYVNAVNAGQCAVLPPDYSAILLNASTNGGTYTLSEGEAISFYDEGGSQGNYSTLIDWNNRWKYTFKAPDGKKVYMKVNSYHTWNAWLCIYDETSNGNTGRYPNGGETGQIFTSTEGVLSVSWYCSQISANANQSGWDILVYVPDDNNEANQSYGGMQYGTVSVIPFVNTDRINTTSDNICFGSEASLTASASSSDAAFPQIYTWYSPDRMEILQKDTIYAGESQYVFTPTQEATYYVALSGSGECPVVETIHDRYVDDVLFTNQNVGYSGNNTTRLTENNIVRIYDDGGPNGNYSASGEYVYSYKYFETNIPNSKIKVHFDTIALADRYTEFRIRNNQTDSYVLRMRGPVYVSDTDIVIESTRIEIYFRNDNSTSSDVGFAGYVHAITPHNNAELAEATVTFTHPTINTSISVNDGEACFGDEVELVATSTGVSSPQIFAWFDADYNLVKLDTVTGDQSTFAPQVLGDATYYVNVSEIGDCPVLPPGYVGQVVQPGEINLKSAHVSVKQPTMGMKLLVSNATVCYGSEAILTAHTDAATQTLLGYPHYITWYAPDGRTILFKDTIDGVNKTQSEFSAPYYYQYQDQNYYVSVGNGVNCPAVIAPTNNIYTVLLNAQTHGQTTMLSSADLVRFYDAGGENGNYHNGNSDNTHTFQTIQGNLQVRFSAMDKGGIEEGDTLYIYDAATADNNAVIGKVSYMEDEDDYGTLSYVSTGKYLTFRFESATSSNDEGWSAFIMPVNQQSEMDTAKVFIQVTSVPEAALTIVSDTVCMGQDAEVSASANISYPQYYVWYNNNMEVLKRDTIHNASESPSKLSLPAHYRNASYYTLVYSDTVSCMILNNNLPKVYSELPITAFSSGMETQVSPSDSIRIYTPETIIRASSDNYDFDYYFTAESGLIQIYFNSLEMAGSDVELEFLNDDLDFKYAEFDDGIYHDVTVTSMSNIMHMQFSRKTGEAFSFDAIVTNINAINNGILSKMAQADVTVNVGSATANVNTTNDTVCYGSPAFLTASSSDPIYPQIYTWYNMDVSEVLLCDTIYSGASSMYIPGQMGAYTYYVLMNNETHPCPLTTIDNHDNFREYLFTEDMNNATLHIGAIDSLVLYDDGGKNGNYSVNIDDNTHINILKLQTDLGSTIHVEIPFLETDQNYSFFAIAEPDANGNLQMESENDAIMIRGQISDFSYNSLTNILYVGWVYYGSDRTQQLPGFEAVFTAEMHPESQLTGAKVVMKNLPMMNTLALAASPTDTTICQGDAVELSATSTLADEPQYFVWYNSDFSKVLAADTVQSGNTGYATLENLTQDTLVYVAVGTDDVCPAYPIDFKYNVQEFYLTEAVSGNTMMLSDVDSVLFYDEGGPNESYESTNVMWYQTFKASDPNAKVTIHFSYIDLDTKYDNNWLVVVQGPLDFSNYSNNSFLHDPFEGSSSDVTMTSDVDNLTVVWNSNDWDSKHKGWAAEVYTNQSVTASTDALDSTFVKVNPSYHYTIYDSVCASATIYNVDRFLGIDISVPGDYTIDSVYQTALGCDSIYSLQLHVMGNPHIATPAVTNVNCYHGTDGAIIVTENDVEYGTAPFTFALSKESVPVQDFNTLSAGNYVLSVSDKYGCHSDTILVLTEPDTLQFLSCPTGGEYQTVLGQTYAKINLIAPDYAPVGNNASVETSGVEATNHYDVGVHTITYVVTNSCHESDTCRFTITVVPSTQPISITSSTNSWPFDGEWHQGTYEVTYGGVALTAETGSEGLIFTIPVSNDTLTIVRDASAKVRDYTPTPVPNLFSYNLQNSDHYSQPTLDTGSLEITKNTTTPVTVTVTGHSNSTFFDSNEHTVTGFDLSSDNALFDLSSVRFNGTVADSTASRTAVDTTYMTMDETMFSTEDVNFAFVNFVVHNGYQAITPNTTTDIIVTVKEHGGVVTYDGYEHHVSGFDLVSISSSVYTAEYFHYEGAVDDSIVRGRYVGSYQMNVDSNSFVNDNINYSNVRFVVLNDSLVITPNPTSITITANSAAKLYDGTPLVDSGYSYIPNDVFAMGDTLIVEISGSITEVGEVENKVVDYKVYRNESHNSSMIKSISVPTGYTKDVTDCYTFSLPVSGVLSVVDTLKVSSVVTSGQMCPGESDGTATITVVGGKEKTPDRYEYSIEGSNTGYNNTGHTEGEILLYSLSVDKYVVTVTDDLGFTATDTFSIVERPVITTATQFDCPADIDTVITHGGCNIVLNLGTPNFVAPAGLDMADVTIYNNAPADSVFGVGELTITWVAKGLCGDSVTCEQHIKVSFQTCPDAVDREGNTYPSVRLGSGCKCWTTENLKSTLYSDGRPIEDVMDYYSSEFPDTELNVSIFGHLYNWYAAADTLRYGSVDSVENAYRSGNRIQGICPENWYLPSDEDYEELNIYPTTDLRSTSYWVNVTGVVNTNATGFNSLPGGMYNCSTGRFEQMSGESYYWTCHPVYDMATGALIDYICEKIRYSNSSRCNGYSIRCVYDEH